MREEGVMETMTIREVARLIDWCRANGLSDTNICNCLVHIATGTDVPIRSYDDSEGMTNSQYKGMLLDLLGDWEETLDLAIKAENVDIQKEVKMQIEKINKKLKF